jgi:nitrate/nitrite-specific signal transduction histidine kinase
VTPYSDPYVRLPLLREWPARGSLRNKILTRSFVPTAIILVAVALVSFIAYQRVTESLVIERDRELTRLSASLLTTELAAYTDPVAEQYLASFDAVIVFSPSGAVLTAEPEQYQDWVPTWFKGASLLQILQSPEPVFSDVLEQGLSGEKLVVVIMPLRGRQGEPMGGIAGLFRLNPAADSALYRSLEKLQRDESRRIYLVDGAGRVIYHSHRDYIGEDFATQAVVQQVMAGGVDAYRTRDFEGHEIVASFAPVPGTPWGLVTEESWALLTESSRRYGRLLLLLLGLGVMAPTLIVTIGVRRITRPIAALIRGAREIASGNFEQRIHATTGDELEALADQFNHMAAELHESYSLLEQRVADRTKELAALNAIAAQVSHSLQLEPILQRALDEILNALGMQRGLAFRLDEEDGWLVLVSHRGATDDLVRHAARRPLEVGAWLQQVRVCDVAGYPLGRWKERLGEAGIQQVICIPLRAKGRLVGVIELMAFTPRAVSAEERSLLTGIGHQVGLAVENARLFEQAQQLAVVRERNRLAGDLHDSVTQALYGVALCAQAAARELDKGGVATAADYLRAIHGSTLEALREMRVLIFELRPPPLKRAGLPGALQARLEAVEARLGVETVLEAEGEGPLPAEVEAGLYRVAQEALNNALKHAQAKHVKVWFRQTEGAVELEIVDDGIGFDLAEVQGQGGFGLRGMEERVTRLGGQWTVKSRPGHGTCVRVHLECEGAPVAIQAID